MSTNSYGKSTMGKLLPIAVAAIVFFGVLSVYWGGFAAESYGASKTYKVTITVNMGKNGSSCPALYFKKGSETKYAWGSKWYSDGKRISEPWTKSEEWYKSHNVKVVFTSVKLAKGKYKVVCDNGVKTKTVISKLNVKKAIKRTVKF